MGCVGAAIAGTLYYAVYYDAHDHGKPFSFNFLVLTASLISGFLSCFFLSRRHLKLMEGRTWQYGIPRAAIYGAGAGAVTGAVTGLVCVHIGPVLGVLAGGLIGIVIGFISWLIFGQIVLGFLMKD